MLAVNIAALLCGTHVMSSYNMRATHHVALQFNLSHQIATLEIPDSELTGVGGMDRPITHQQRRLLSVQ